MDEKKNTVEIIEENQQPDPKNVEGNGKLSEDSLLTVDARQYKKRWTENLDRRFLSIFLASLAFNVILVLYVSHIPFEVSADYVRKFQEHYANFIYETKPAPVEPESAQADQNLLGEAAEQKEAEPNKEGESGSGNEEAAKTNAPGEGGEASSRERAVARRAARTKSTEEIAREVSNKGLLGLLTGTGSAAQGEAIQDILGESGAKSSGNLDEVLSGIDGIKTSGSASGSNGEGKGGIRGGRSQGTGSGIDDLVEGLTSASSSGFGTKTEKMVVSNASLKAESGKSAGRDPEAVLQVVNSHRAAIEYCYQRALRRNPNLKGKISVRFVISPAGNVKDVKVLSSTLSDPSVERCIVAKIRRWRDFGAIDPAKGDAVFRQDYIFGY